MNVPVHPDPERLAALAGNDADVRADRGLTDHVAGCEVCGAQVRELSVLRSALAELPDVAPSRPLVLLPPHLEERPVNWRIELRRLFAPMAVAGMVLLLVGSVGATGALSDADGTSFLSRLLPAAAAPELAEDPDGSQTDSEASPPSGEGVGVLGPTNDASGRTAAPAPGESSGGADGDRDAETGQPGPEWILVALAGMGLLGGALILRRQTG